MMKFGETQEVKDARARERFLRRLHGERHFAWLPKRMTTGEWVWLEKYYIYERGRRGISVTSIEPVPEFDWFGNIRPQRRYYATQDEKWVDIK